MLHGVHRMLMHAGRIEVVRETWGTGVLCLEAAAGNTVVLNFCDDSALAQRFPRVKSSRDIPLLRNTEGLIT